MYRSIPKLHLLREDGERALNREASSDGLWLKIDVLGIGLAVVMLAGLLVVARTRSDPLIIVAAAYILIPYLFGYIVLGGMGRLIQIGCRMAFFGLAMMIVGSFQLAVDRDATLLVYLAAPGLGLFVSSTAACIGSRRRSSASAPTDER